VLATKGLQLLAGSCGVISTAAAEKMTKLVRERSAMKQEAATEASKRKEISRTPRPSLLTASPEVLPSESNLPT